MMTPHQLPAAVPPAGQAVTNEETMMGMGTEGNANLFMGKNIFIDAKRTSLIGIVHKKKTKKDEASIFKITIAENQKNFIVKCRGFDNDYDNTFKNN